MIADDHPLVRSGLRMLLERGGEFEVIAEASNGDEAIDQRASGAWADILPFPSTSRSVSMVPSAEGVVANP